MKAVVVQGMKQAHVADITEPKLRPDYVKVKVSAVALNPTDWKHVDLIGDAGSLVGCDFVGTVEELGSSVKSSVKPGDRISGFIHGANLSNHEDGSFAEHVVVKDGLFIKVPSSMSDEDASTLGVGVTTVGQALYQSLKLPLPGSGQTAVPQILIYGGSTATGSLAIQYAKLSGSEVITTASSHNESFLKSLGASKVFDYNSPTCAADIRSYTNNNLRYVMDCIALEPTGKICAEALSSDPSGGELHYSSLLPVKPFPRDDVNARFTMAYTATGEEYFKFGRTSPAKPQDYEFAASFWKASQALFDQGKISVHPPVVGQKGLEGVITGLQELAAGKVSGKKLVYRVADTPGIKA